MKNNSAPLVQGGNKMKKTFTAIVFVVILAIFSMSVVALSPAENECTSTNYLQEGETIGLKHPVTKILVKNDVYNFGGTPIEYKGADAITNPSPKIKFKNMDTGDTIEYSVQYANGVATFSVKLQGKEYKFRSASNPAVNDFDIAYISDYQTKVVTLKTVDLDIEGTPFVRFSVDGEMTGKLTRGDIWGLADGTVITNHKILNQDYAGGVHASWFCLDGHADSQVFMDTLAPTPAITPFEGDLDLSRIHKLFVKDGRFNGYFVVGTNAPASDNLAMTDIATAFDRRGVEVVNAAKLDSEINHLNSNMIVVGRPCENTITNKLLGDPSSCTIGLEPGETRVQLFENNGYAQLLISGYSKTETRITAKILADYIETQLTGGNALAITGTKAIVTGTVGNARFDYTDELACGDSYGGDGWYTACVGDTVKHSQGLKMKVMSFDESNLKLNAVGTSYTIVFDHLRQVEHIEFEGLDYLVEFNLVDGEKVTIHVKLAEVLLPDSPRPISPPIEVPRETPRVTPIVSTCSNGCQQNGNCLPYGTRLVQDGTALYCGINGGLQGQLNTNELCQNNYECSSNQCVSGSCSDLRDELERTNSLLEKILALLMRIFGRG
jgi:hypothetical protein